VSIAYSKHNGLVVCKFVFPSSGDEDNSEGIREANLYRKLEGKNNVIPMIDYHEITSPKPVIMIFPYIPKKRPSRDPSEIKFYMCQLLMVWYTMKYVHNFNIYRQ
jgi:serine/threonine protein kinase